MQYIPAHHKRVECYAKAAPYLDPPAERHEVPFETFACRLISAFRQDIGSGHRS